MGEKYGEKIVKEKEEYMKKITQLLIEGLTYGGLKVKCKPIGLDVLTVDIIDEEGYKILEIWTGNRDEGLTNMTNYSDTIYFPEEDKRKELMESIIKKLK